MEIKAKDMCPKCKYCLGMTPQGMYSCGYNNDGSELNIGVDVVLNCANFEWFEWKDEKAEGRYPWGSDEDKVLKYCANDVTIIAEQMAREKQKELEDKVEKYEKILIDILNETYEHPQLFEHNIHAYELIPGHIRFLKNSFNIMCDKYDPIFEENTKLKEELEETKNRYAKFGKKNNELQLKVSDLIFQHQEDTKKIVELKDDKYRILKENEYLRNRYPTYSAMKAEDKIEHIQKEAKKWKNKYKEAYDILQEFFGEHSNIMSISYDISGDLLTLKLLYDDSAYAKHNRLENARERMKELD